MSTNNATDTFDTKGTAVAVVELDRAALNLSVTWEEALAQSGLDSADMVFVGSPYTVLNKDKDILVNNPFFVRNVSIGQDQTTGKEYAVLYCVTRANEMFVVTDGSTGIFAQVQTLVAQREADGHPTPRQNILVASGLRKSEYGINAEGVPTKFGEKAVDTGTTYYFA